MEGYKAGPGIKRWRPTPESMVLPARALSLLLRWRFRQSSLLSPLLGTSGLLGKQLLVEQFLCHRGNLLRLKKKKSPYNLGPVASVQCSRILPSVTPGSFHGVFWSENGAKGQASEGSDFQANVGGCQSLEGNRLGSGCNGVQDRQVWTGLVMTIECLSHSP